MPRTNDLKHQAKNCLVLTLIPLFTASLGFSASAQEKSAGVRPSSASAVTTIGSNLEQDGLIGAVRRVRTETAKLTANSDGKLVEGPRVLLETSTYDMKGARIDNAYYPVEGSTQTGKEEYSYDDKGNLVEKVVRSNDDGSILSIEVYDYEVDVVGNWTKMVTRVTVTEDGKRQFKPADVTYRTITYYFNDAIAKRIETASPTVPATVAATAESPVSSTDQEGLDGAKLAANHVSSMRLTNPAAELVAGGAQKSDVAKAEVQDAAIEGADENRLNAAAEKAGAADAALNSAPTGMPCAASNKGAPLVVAGAVSSPGTFYVQAGTAAPTLRESLMLANGAQRRAGRSVYVIRSTCQRQTQSSIIGSVETYGRTATEEGRVNLERPLGAGDIVFVAENDVAFITGAIARPSIVRVRNNLTLLGAVQSLGGTLDKARRDRVRLRRLLPDGVSYQQFIINLTEIEEHRIGDVVLSPGDIVEIPSIDSINRTDDANSFAALLQRAALHTPPLTTTGPLKAVVTTKP